MKRFFLWFGGTVLLIFAIVWVYTLYLPSNASFTPLSSSLMQGEEKQRGMSWTAEPEPITVKNLESLVDLHVNWMVQTPFGWQTDYNTPDVKLSTQNAYWGETDEGLKVTTQLALAKGIKTLLKPHIWITHLTDGKWLTDIDMKSEAEWQQWFRNYRRFILHYAEFAQQNNIEILCIGTELQNPAIEREADWRQLITDIRQIYSGKLTYAANWDKEFEQIKFWDELDFMGIQAYFPLSQQASPTVETLTSGWQSALKTIQKVQSQYQKPVLFTEIGYRSSPDAAIEPWKWPETSEGNPTILATEAGLLTQANCYEAFFQAVWPQEWFAGAYWWKWMPSIATNDAKVGAGFTPQNKPAAAILKKWYGG